jgi:phosphate transport system protein
MSNFDLEIATVKKKLLTMAALSNDAVQRAIRAVLTRDAGLAITGKEMDKDIDALEMEVDERVVALFPKARTPEELRWLTVIMKIARDLERVGDEATTISRRAFQLSQEGQSGPSIDINRRADMVLSMLNDALDAFVSANPARARAVIPRDKEVDALNKQLHEDLTKEIMRTPRVTPYCLNLMTVSKSLERIGDHAKNIAEDVVFLFEARDIRHTGKGKVRRGEPPKDE